jgi:hypothetical protein
MLRFTTVLIAVFATVGLGSASATLQAPAGASAERTFSGSADKTLPPITLEVPSTLRWTSNSPIFLILPSSSLTGGSVNSAARAGATYLAAGPHQLGVKAFASWTIRIVPGIERPRAIGGGLVGFRGQGGRDLPPFTLKRGKTLVWTSGGQVFRLSGDPFMAAIKSQAKRGTRSVAAGSHTWTVNATGTWSVGWKP